MRQNLPDGYGFQALIEALTILENYAPTAMFPTSCEHYVLYVHAKGPPHVAPVDVLRLEVLGFVWNGDVPAWESFRFGST